MFYRLSIADAVITFVLEVVYLVVIFFGTLEKVVSLHVLTPVVPVPALSDRQFWLDLLYLNKTNLDFSLS